jgi:hypothetical protein
MREIAATELLSRRLGGHGVIDKPQIIAPEVNTARNYTFGNHGNRAIKAISHCITTLLVN